MQNRLLVKIDHEDIAHRDILVINWMLGNTCNFKCTYCPDHLHNGSMPWADERTAKKFLDKIFEHYGVNKNKNIYVEFTGGEVSCYEQITKICRYVHDRGHAAGLISNGSAARKFWREIFPYLKHVSLSFHPMSSKSDHFKKIFELLIEKVSLHINIMMVPEKFDDCRNLGEYLCNNFKNFSISFQPLMKVLSQNTDLLNYSKDQLFELRMLEKNLKVEWDRSFYNYRGALHFSYDDNTSEKITVPQIIMDDCVHWEGWKCWAGLDELAIGPDGNIYRAWCQQDTIGHINDKNLVFPTEPTTCRTSGCYCNIDILNRRERRILKEEPNGTCKNLSFTKIMTYDDRAVNGNSTSEVYTKNNSLFINLSVKPNNIGVNVYSGVRIALVEKNVVLSKKINIQLRCLYDGVVRINLVQDNIKDYDFYGIEVQLRKGELTYTVNLEDVRQTGWGKVIPFDPGNISEIMFCLNKVNTNLNIELLKIEYY